MKLHIFELPLLVSAAVHELQSKVGGKLPIALLKSQPYLL